MEQRLYSVTLHVTHLLRTWTAALWNERAEVEPLQMEIAGSQVMHANAEKHQLVTSLIRMASLLITPP